MQTVSNAWLAAQKLNFVPESAIQIALSVTDPDAQTGNESSDNGHTVWSNTAQVADETEKTQPKVATLEHNFWALDGTFALLPDDGDCGNAGYNGDAICGADGTFEANPTVTVTFADNDNAALHGITTTWGTAFGEYAKQYRVTAYLDGETVSQYTVTDNAETTSILEAEIANYDAIAVEVLEWSCPNRRARIESIFIGVYLTFTKSDIMDASHEMYVQPLSASLPKAKFSFTLANADKTWNPENPDGLAVYLLERQEISVRYGYKLNGTIEWIKAGTFWLSEWDAPQNGITVTLTARDALEFMTDDYEGSYSGTLYDIAEAAFTQADLPLMADGSQRWYIDESLRDIAASGESPGSSASIAKVLQLTANAACCVLYQDRDGVVRLEPLPSVMSLVSGSVTDNGHAEAANLAVLADGTEYEAQKVYTLEHNLWTLDGTLTGLADGSGVYNGFLSAALCGDDGTFETNPKVTVSFVDLCRTLVPGVTIKWASAYGEYATDFTVTAYNGTTEVVSKSVTGNTLTDTYTEMNMQYFDSVVIEIQGWSVPQRRARIENVLVGIEYLRYEINKDNSYSDSEIELTKQLRNVNVNSGQCVLPVSDTGETQTVSNKLISDAQAPVVAQWVADYLANRKTLSGSFRSDPRLDALDRVRNVNNFSQSVLLVTDVQYTYNGAFRGSYEGRANV